MKKSFYMVFRVLVILIISSLSLHAQFGEPAITPIDGGASFLAAAGLAYGLKKVRDHNRRSSPQKKNRR